MRQRASPPETAHELRRSPLFDTGTLALPAPDIQSLARLAEELTRAEPGDVEGALQSLCRALGATRAVLYTVDLPRERIEPTSAHGMALSALRPRYGKGVAGRVARTGQPIVVPRGWHEPMALEELEEGALPEREQWSLLCTPVASTGRRSGALSVYLPVNVSTAEVLPLVTIAAALLGQALELRRTDRGTQSMSHENPVSVEAHAGAALSEAIPEFEYANMVGSSPAMRGVYEQIGQVAGTNATALLCGESGTGKELVAQAIHDNSRRAGQPFVKLNCAALPEPLFESELFGHERGAFTGAHAQRKGRFELAQGGTLFLDEIGELSLTTQAKLLRVLQFREFERVGGTTTLRTDVRLVAATNKGLEEAVRSGSFREDLFYRLNVFTIRIPPLRERRSDIADLAAHMLRKYNLEHGRKIDHISQRALDLLCHYDYPGNVRELENLVERAVVVCDSHVIQEHHLPPAVHPETPREPSSPEPAGLQEAVERLEREMIESALASAAGNASRAARALGTSERVIRYKMTKYSIDSTRFRGS